MYKHIEVNAANKYVEYFVASFSLGLPSEVTSSRPEVFCENL